MSDWITTPLINAPPSSNSYVMGIDNLEPNNVYEYRAYMVIDGEAYCGNTVIGVTCSSIPTIPMIKTGDAYNVTYNSMRICENKILSDGNSNIYEFGVLYTQNPVFGNNNALNLENYPAFVNKKSILSSILPNEEFFIGSIGEISGLSQNTNTYFRPFAINSIGDGYGETKMRTTEIIPVTFVEVSIVKTYGTALNNSTGNITISPEMPENQSISLNMRVVHSVLGSGNSSVSIVCKPNGSSEFVDIFTVTTDSELYVYDNEITINHGDEIRWAHNNFGGAGSFSVINLLSATANTICVSPTISVNSNSDYVYSTNS